jgi:hypothetical protein
MNIQMSKFDDILEDSCSKYLNIIKDPYDDILEDPCSKYLKDPYDEILEDPCERYLRKYQYRKSYLSGYTSIEYDKVYIPATLILPDKESLYNLLNNPNTNINVKVKFNYGAQINIPKNSDANINNQTNTNTNTNNQTNKESISITNSTDVSYDENIYSKISSDIDETNKIVDLVDDLKNSDVDNLQKQIYLKLVSSNICKITNCIASHLKNIQPEKLNLLFTKLESLNLANDKYNIK